MIKPLSYSYLNQRPISVAFHPWQKLKSINLKCKRISIQEKSLIVFSMWQLECDDYF